MADALPATLRALLTLRVGEPHGRARGGTKEQFDFSVSDGYGVFRERCLVRFKAVCAVLEQTRKPLLRLQASTDIYFKKAKNDPQDQYVCLDATNFASSMEHRWRRHIQSAAATQDLLFDCFLYVDNEANAKTYRATTARVDGATVRRRAHEAANQIAFGPITGHHLDVVNARLPDGSAFVVPPDNTTRQAMELDAMREELRTTAHEGAGMRGPRTMIVNMKLNGAWVPVEVDCGMLRLASGLPEHDIFTQGIYHGFRLDPETPSHAAQTDVDHEDDGDDVENV